MSGYLCYNIYIDMNEIYIYESTVPKCPSCNNNTWVVKQRLVRSSDLMRIDGLGDIVVKPFDPSNYHEAISLTCSSCGYTAQPQSGVSATEDGRQDVCSVYDETSLEEVVWPKRVNNDELF